MIDKPPYLLFRTVVLPLMLAAVVIAWQFGAIAREVPQDPGAVFPVETLTIETATGTHTFSVEIADEPGERERGLMFREAMLPTHGMLFDFGKVEPVFMWMKNTPLPLDMVFVKPDGTVARIVHNTKPQSLRIIRSGWPVSHVLELNAGTSRRIGLKEGDVLAHPSFKQ